MVVKIGASDFHEDIRCGAYWCFFIVVTVVGLDDQHANFLILAKRTCCLTSFILSTLLFLHPTVHVFYAC